MICVQARAGAFAQRAGADAQQGPASCQNSILILLQVEATPCQNHEKCLSQRRPEQAHPIAQMYVPGAGRVSKLWPR
eukprot:2158710-Lingulodinium_polyedra.AAC.1